MDYYKCGTCAKLIKNATSPGTQGCRRGFPHNWSKLELHLSQDQIVAALPLVAPGLVRYSWLQAEFQKQDVTHDGEYQTRFFGFYRLRRGGPWRSIFFGILEETKTKQISFADVLGRLQAATGNVEASFASKLVATRDPEQPVIDSFVLRYVGLKLPGTYAANRIPLILELHGALAHIYSVYLASESGIQLVKSFEEAYPNSELTKIKMLDLILWQTRD